MEKTSKQTIICKLKKKKHSTEIYVYVHGYFIFKSYINLLFISQLPDSCRVFFFNHCFMCAENKFSFRGFVFLYNTDTFNINKK